MAKLIDDETSVSPETSEIGETDTRIDKALRSTDLIAVNTLGQFAKHPRVGACSQLRHGAYLRSVTAVMQTQLTRSGGRGTEAGVR